MATWGTVKPLSLGNREDLGTSAFGNNGLTVPQVAMK